MSLHDNNIYWYEMFWVRVVRLASFIECVPRYPGGRSPSSSSYVYSSFSSGEPYIVRIEHAFVTQPLTRGYPETSSQTLGNLQVILRVICFHKPRCYHLTYPLLLLLLLLLLLTFYCAVVLSLSFTDFAFFRSILTGEIAKLHIVIGAKSKTKRYTTNKV